MRVNRVCLREYDLREIPELKQIYEGYSKWEWRFGETP